MMLPDKKYAEWIALIIVSIIGYGTALYGYNQMINIPPPTTAPIAHRTIFISSPKINEEIKSPVNVSGKAMAQEDNIVVRVKDENNSVLKETLFHPSKKEFSNFLVGLDYETPTTKKGLIETFEYSTDGDMTNRRVVPITFSEYEE